MSKLAPLASLPAGGLGTSGVVGASGLAVFGQVGPNREQLGRFFEDDPVGRAIREAIAKAVEQGVKFGVQKLLDSPVEDIIKEAAGGAAGLHGILVVKAVQRYFRDIAFHEIQDELERQRRAEEAARRAREQLQEQQQEQQDAAERRAGRLRSAGRAAYERFLRRADRNRPDWPAVRAKARAGLRALGVSDADLDEIEARVGDPSQPRDEPCR